MRSTHYTLLLVLAAASPLGCYTEDEYSQDLNTARCEWYEACGYLETLGYDAVEDCVDERDRVDELDEAEGIGICEDFNASNAKTCVEEWEALACETSEEDYPAACDAVCSE